MLATGGRARATRRRRAGGGDVLRAALERVHVRELERKHREGYRRKPVKKTEFAVWEREQVWTE